MRVTIELAGVNQRRYSRAWIAKVTSWPIGKPPVLSFGSNITYDKCEIDAMPGDILRYGRRDHRGNKSFADWCIVQDDLDTVDVSADKARDHWLATQESV